MSSAVSEMEEESRKLDESVEGASCVYEATEGVSCVAEDVDIALGVSVDDNISVDASSLSSSTMGVGGAGVLQDAKGSNARISYVGTELGSSLHFREGLEGGFEGVKDGNARAEGVCIEIVSRGGSDLVSRADDIGGGALTDSSGGQGISGWVAVANGSNGCLDRYVDVGYVEESGASHFVESGVGEGSSVLRVAEGGVEGVKDVNVCADGVGGGNVMQSARVSWGSGVCGVSQGGCDLPLPLSLQENFRLPVITDLGSRFANQQFSIRLSQTAENSRYVVHNIEGQDGSMCLLVAVKGEDAQRLLQGKSLCCCIVKCLLVPLFVSTT